MDFKIKSIPENKKTDWTVKIDDQEKKVKKIEIHNDKFGTLFYGLRPEGYDSWMFQEKKEGSVITLPYAITSEKEIIVGLILENRSNMGDKPVYCAIGGFIDKGETSYKAQIREAFEETTLSTNAAEKLPGPPTNYNRALFIADPTQEEGLHFYSLKIPLSSLIKKEDHWEIKNNSLIHFFPWKEAITISPDSMVGVAIAKLLSKVLP